MAEEFRFRVIKSAGCLCCIAMGYPHDPDGHVVEAHHMLSGGIRIGHAASIGLCLWHHKGRLIVEGWSFADHRERLGPSLAEGSKAFHAVFGTDEQLLARQAKLIAEQLRYAA